MSFPAVPAASVMPTAPVVSAPSPVDILGPLLVGAFLSTLFYGITLVQFFSYYEGSKQDPIWMRMLVAYLFIAETCGAALDVLVAYQPLVLEFGTIPDLVPLFLRSDGALTVAISTPVQIFMAWRIMILTGSKIPSFVILSLALAALTGGIWTSLELTLNPRFASLDNIRVPPILWLLSSALADIMITTSLVYSLSKKKTGYDVMDGYLSHIIRLTIQTGAFTAIAAIADVVVFLSVSRSTIFFIWDLSLSKLYINSMLSSLNARNTFRESRNALFSSENTSSVVTDSQRNPKRRSYVSTYNQQDNQQELQLQMPPKGVPQGLPFERPRLRPADLENPYGYQQKYFNSTSMNDNRI